MRWSQEQLEAETPERREALAWLIHARRLAELPIRQEARSKLSDAGQTVIDLALYPGDDE